MTEKTIEQKASELFIERHGITAEEFAENESFMKSTFSYKHCVLYYSVLEMAKAFENLFRNAWNGLKAIASEIAYIHGKTEKKKVLRSKWTVNRDTRLKSQVMNNKPRYSVRKIIR